MKIQITTNGNIKTISLDGDNISNYITNGFVSLPDGTKIKVYDIQESSQLVNMSEHINSEGNIEVDWSPYAIIVDNSN